MNDYRKNRKFEEDIPEIIKSASEKDPFKIPDGYFDSLGEKICRSVENAPPVLSEKPQSKLSYIFNNKWRAIAASIAMILIAGFTYAFIAEVVIPAINNYIDKKPEPGEVSETTFDNNNDKPDQLSILPDGDTDTITDDDEISDKRSATGLTFAEECEKSSPTQQQTTDGKAGDTDGSIYSQTPYQHTDKTTKPRISVYETISKKSFKDTTVCKGAILNFRNELHPMDHTFHWTLDGRNIATEHTNTISIRTNRLSEGTHQLSLIVRNKRNNRIVAVDNARITVVAHPVIDEPLDICSYNKANLSAGQRNPNWSYQWSTGNNTSNITVTESGKYWVKISAVEGTCYAVDTFTVNVLPKPNVNLGSDKTVCASDKIRFKIDDPDSQYEISWYPGNIKGQEFEFSNNNPGTYYVTVAVTGCNTVTDQVRVVVADCNLRIPNVFTPNGDGRNDEFVIEGLERYNKSKLIVTDRNGRVVYESDDYNNDWDGGNLPNGTYFFVLYPDGTENSYRKGTVMILR